MSVIPFPDRIERIKVEIAARWRHELFLAGQRVPEYDAQRDCIKAEIVTNENETSAAAEVASARRKMPMGGDTVHLRIAQHREAVSLYDLCVDAECEAEDKVSDEEYDRLQKASARAYEDMMFFARCLIIDVPTTRTGLIKWTRYMRMLLVDWRGTNSGSPYLPDKIGDEPWINRFFKILTDRLGKMDKPDGKRPRKPRR